MNNSSEKNVTTLIIGGTRGIGSVVKQMFLGRGDRVYTASRSAGSESNHLTIRLPDISGLDENIKLSYLVFTHRYRGNDWGDDFDVTVKSIDAVINALVDGFQGDASIVIIGSNAGQFVVDEQSASYHATRAALEGLVRYYAVKLGSRGIRCNCVLPNSVIKPENKDFFSKDNEVRKMINEITPLGRMGSAEDIAKLVEFLCSPSSKFITGQSIHIDGGLSVRGQESIARQLSELKHPNLK